MMAEKEKISVTYDWDRTYGELVLERLEHEAGIS